LIALYSDVCVYLFGLFSVDQMHRLINQIGTPTDTPELHDKL